MEFWVIGGDNSTEHYFTTYNFSSKTHTKGITSVVWHDYSPDNRECFAINNNPTILGYPTAFTYITHTEFWITFEFPYVLFAATPGDERSGIDCGNVFP